MFRLVTKLLAPIFEALKPDLILVPTPIGNLEDITLRAIRCLKEATTILCEDTRVTLFLLKHLEIEGKRVESFHAHNEHFKLASVIDRIKKGEKMVLVSDAGTPGISDPGFLLTRACVEADLSVECLPGPTAFVPALIKSGLPCDRFVFEGFLPVKKGRKTCLEALAQETRTMIFYESPHRIERTLQDFVSYFGEERQISFSRELTKVYEETLNGSVIDILNQIQKRTSVKGEIVLLAAGKPQK